MSSLRREQPARPRKPAPSPSSSTSPGRITGQDAARRQAWNGKSPREVLAMYPPCTTPALGVVDVMIELLNAQRDKSWRGNGVDVEACLPQ